jgi:hypothetical protein
MSKALTLVDVQKYLPRISGNLMKARKQAGKGVTRWRRTALRSTKSSPGRGLLSALVAGFVFAKLTSLFG